LREACIELAKVDIKLEKYLMVRAEVRKAALLQWLNLIQLFDNSYNPTFNIEDGGPIRVQPPKTKGGIVYPPGADPKLIDDPVARAAYKKTIEDNRKRLENYRLQVHLSRLKDKIPSEVKNFILENYTKLKIDQDELNASIKSVVKNKARQEELLKLPIE
jgi:hypothetical protein